MSRRFGARFCIDPGGWESYCQEYCRNFFQIICRAASNGGDQSFGHCGGSVCFCQLGNREKYIGQHASGGSQRSGAVFSRDAARILRSTTVSLQYRGWVDRFAAFPMLDDRRQVAGDCRGERRVGSYGTQFCRCWIGQLCRLGILQQTKTNKRQDLLLRRAPVAWSIKELARQREEAIHLSYHVSFNVSFSTSQNSRPDRRIARGRAARPGPPKPSGCHCLVRGYGS